MTDTAPPRLWRRPPLRNTLGEVVEVVDDEQGNPRATAPGRLVVVAGQTIASAWGNTTYDQTCQVFTTDADRSNQWPAPSDGAQSWLADSGTPWVYRAGAWHGIPTGYVASVIGPASALALGTGRTVILTLAVALTAGRKYRVSSSGYVTVTAACNAFRAALEITPQGTGISNQYINSSGNVLAGAGESVGSALAFGPLTTTTYTVTLATPQINGTGGNAAANSCIIFVEDIGG